MYRELKNVALAEQVEKITTSLVQTLSINGTKGEVEIADRIEAILRSYPYFQSHPDRVWTQALPHDPLGRKNVFARLKGGGSTKRTVIFHAHLDTVGIEDYAHLQGLAHNPEQLLRFFEKWEENKEIQVQALSGDWMFGRGAVDMKSGIAVHLANVLYFSEHREDWAGEIIFMANPVEENQHTGIMAAVDELLRLRQEEKLEFICAINTDYISPLFPGDRTKYIYTGAGGKLLPCFYVYGREAHVGQTLTGLDPTLVTSELNRLIGNNMDLTEQMEGELIIPPSTLHQRDSKAFYNVQTAVTGLLYFNFMVLAASPKDVLAKLKNVALQAVANVQHYYEEQYRSFAETNGFPAELPSWKMEVYTYQEFCAKLAKQGVNVAEVTARVVAEQPDLELRQLCFRIVDTLRQLDQKANPCTVMFFAPPYCPHNYLKGDNARDEEVLVTIKQVLKHWEHASGEQFAVKRFFPYLSDSSYLSLHDTDEEVAALIENFPEWTRIYPVPVAKIRELNIPAINVGVYGLDAHRWTERVFKPYSFGIVPGLIRDMSQSWLRK